MYYFLDIQYRPCDFDLKNCNTLQNDELEYQVNLPEALNQSFDFLKKSLNSEEEYIFVFNELEYEKGSLFHSKDFSNWKNMFIDNTFIQHNENIELQIDKNKRIISITQTNPNGLILFKNGELKNWNIIFSGYKKKKILKRSYDLSPMNLTGCINIYKTNIITFKQILTIYFNINSYSFACIDIARSVIRY